LALLTRSGLMTLQPSGMSCFKNTIACITGSASGIGSALAEQAGREGVKGLVLADIAWPEDREDLRDAHPFIRELEVSGVEVETLTVDIGKQEEAQKMREACEYHFGGANLLFQNAGVGMPGVLSATDSALQRAMDINLHSVIWGMRAFVPMMEGLNGPCRIVNTASLAGISEATGLYGLTKHAVVAATEAVASELAWRKSNVEVAVLCPSYVRTNVVRSTAAAHLDATGPALDRDTLKKVQQELEGLPRLIAGGMEPSEVAAIVFDGLQQGRRYIYTDEAHMLAALEDRVEQLKAGGLPPDFKRRMELVVDQELAKG